MHTLGGHGRLEPVVVDHDHGARRGRQHLQNRFQAVPHVRDTGPCVGGERFEDFCHFLVARTRARRLGLLEPPPCACQCQPLAEHQILDPLDVVDVGLPIEPWALRRLLDPDARKLLLPRPQNVGLQLDDLADVRSLEQLRGHGHSV